MFPVEHVGWVSRAAEFANICLGKEAVQSLEQYADWLVREAIPAGGLGPREGNRIWSRHIGDSLTFAAAWNEAPVEILDVGTGVGLPGIPLAIAWPNTTVTLLDRGGRRVRLLHRVVRALALPNVIIAQGDAFSVADVWGGLTFRGSIPPPEAVGLASRLLELESTAVIGLSRKPERPERGSDLISLAEALGLEAELRKVPKEVLDDPSWLLIMRS